MRLNRPPSWPRFRSELHSEAVAARVGRVLGACFGICFVTGLLSHYQYQPWHWLPVPATPAWGYRLSQGVHVSTGIACIPLILVKLWTVYPKLFQWPPARSVLQGLERLSIGLLVSSALLELGTGFLDILGWYPWPWQFVIVHYLLAYVVIGSILLHIAVKYEAIRRGLATPLRPRRSTPVTSGLSRRDLLTITGLGVAAVTAVTAGRTVTPLRRLGLLADRQPQRAPAGVPVNKTADEAAVREAIMDPSYRLQVVGPRSFTLSLAELEDLDRICRHFPLACVEGWSAAAHWAGPTLLSLVQRAGGSTESTVQVESLQRSGAYRTSVVRGPQLGQALLATHLNGERINADHGYPVRLIAPDRAGVLNTKWLAKVTVL